MSIDRHLGFPNTLLHLVQACTRHPGIVKDVKDPTGSGRVRVECQSLWGEGKSNWILYSGSAIGGPKSKGGKNTGDWSPALVGQYVMLEAPGGNTLKWTASPGGASMFDKGNPGSKRA
jgi:hypothetical protein